MVRAGDVRPRKGSYSASEAATSWTATDGASQLSEGDLYICGLNPGGSGNEPHQHTIRESLARLPAKTSDNYFDESWRRYPRGAHLLQRRLRWLVRELGYDLREVYVSNLECL